MSIPFSFSPHKLQDFNFFTDLYQKTVKQDSQHSHESGFQSATSLNSLEGPKDYSPPTSHVRGSPPGSTITGSIENDRNLSNRRLHSADSYGSLASTYLPQRSSIIKEDLIRYNIFKVCFFVERSVLEKTIK